MKRLNQRELLGVAVALVVVGVFLLSRSFVFSFFTQSVAPNPADSTDSTNSAEFNNQISETSMENTNAGLKVEDVVVGGGAEAVVGKSVAVNYTGKLVDGTIFDSSYPRGETFSFLLGSGQVIQGWDIGVAGMKVGGKRILTIPPELAYGDRAVGAVIPANATLVFDVELVAVQ